MGDHEQINKLAIKDVEAIDKQLRKQPPGSIYRKSFLVTRFNMAHNRGSLVFELLRQKGYIVERFTLSTPIEPPAS